MKRAVVKPQFEFRAAVRRHLACYRRALNNYRAILFILMLRIARAFRHSVSSPISVMSRLYGRSLSWRPTLRDPVRPSRHDRVYIAARRALLLRVLRAKPGEHSFAEEAKVANYRVASREGGLMRSPMTGHIRGPLFAPAGGRCRATIPRWRQRAPTAA